MPLWKILNDFTAQPGFQWISLAVGVIGAILAIFATIDSVRTKRLYKAIFETVEKNLDKSVTEEVLEEKKSQVNAVSSQISDLKRQIEIEIPIEAKRTVLKERIDANIKGLEQSLLATLGMQRELRALGVSANIPQNLLDSIQKEISPFYVENARHEAFKTYLIVIMAASLFTSVVFPGEVRIFFQIPLFVMGLFILIRLFRGFTSKAAQSVDTGTRLMLGTTFLIGAITIGLAANSFQQNHLQRMNTEGDVVKVYELVIDSVVGLVTTIFTVWSFRKRRGILWRALSSFCSVVSLLILIFTAFLMINTFGIPINYESAQLLELYGLCMASVALASLAIRTFSKLLWFRMQ